MKNQISLYHIVAWAVEDDDDEQRKEMVYHDWLVAKNDGNAKVKAMNAEDWKGSDDPDDYMWTIAMVS